MKLLEQNDALILTANARLSSYLKKTYDAHQLSLGRMTWETLSCLPFQEWIHQQSLPLTGESYLLNDTQILQLWEEIITESNLLNTIFQPQKIAELAKQSWDTLQKWQLSIDILENNFSEDISIFYQWAITFEHLCKKNNWITEHNCYTKLIDAIDHQIVKVEKNVVIAGFDEISPLTAQLIEAIKTQTSVDFYETNILIQPNIQAIGLANEKEEIKQMALWAKNRLDENPEQKIACVAPHLNQIRESIIDIFTETFSESALDIINTKTQPFNISASASLYEYPMIHAVFELLSMNRKHISLHQISSILRSAFIGKSESEMLERARLNKILHDKQERKISFSSIIETTQRYNLCQNLMTNLQVFFQHQPKPKEKNTLMHWQNIISQQLSRLGWPGERTLNSAEFQQFKRWHELLTEFNNLDITCIKPITYKEAISKLKTLARQTKFQPKTETMPIQILGVLESSGMTFDHIWIMGMNDDKWPQPPTPNPFIPIDIQRKYKMPHASSEKELQFSQAIMKRFHQSAQNITFSYALKQDDQELHPSPLITTIPLKTIPEISAERLQKVQLESIKDEIAPKLTSKETIRGGASILKDQSACPFRAFAKHRLGAQTLPAPISGLSPQERGNLVHTILEKIWETLQDHQTLISYETSDLDKLIEKHIAQTLKQKSFQLSCTLKKEFIRLEQQRLFNLIKQWMDIEKTRPTFSVINHEASKTINFEGLNLKLRIDREDKLQTGERLIIDYKTGAPKISDWFSDRPEDPQLPLYLLTSDVNIDGLLFAQIRPKEFQYKGISANDIDIKGVTPIDSQKADPDITDWETFKTRQHETLSKLSHDFQKGKSTVDPKDIHHTCTYCDLSALCRIYQKPGFT